MANVDFFIEAVIAMLLITLPFNPPNVLFFNTAIERERKARAASALLVAFVVLVVLVGAAIVGREFLELMGINLDAFSVVGGLIIVGMGAEMLYGGLPSKAQGRKIEEEGPDPESGLIIPLSIPLIAGPGAIVTTITIASNNDIIDPLMTALVGAVVVAIVVFVSFALLGGLISRLSATATALLVRIGGLLLATIGAQLALGGLKDFFAA